MDVMEYFNTLQEMCANGDLTCNECPFCGWESCLLPDRYPILRGIDIVKNYLECREAK